MEKFKSLPQWAQIGIIVLVVLLVAYAFFNTYPVLSLFAVLAGVGYYFYLQYKKSQESAATPPADKK